MADEYIRKQDAMQIAFKSPFFSDSLMEEIKSLPPASVAPVVRCQHCTHYMPPHACLHDDGMITAQKDGFCSYGEEKG